MEYILVDDISFYFNLADYTSSCGTLCAFDLSNSWNAVTSMCTDHSADGIDGLLSANEITRTHSIGRF